jgi:hypothetical protein
LTREALDVTGTVQDYELLDSSQNVVVETVARGADHLAATHDARVCLDKTIRETLHIRASCGRLFDHFGSPFPEERAVKGPRLFTAESAARNARAPFLHHLTGEVNALSRSSRYG